MSRSRTNPLPAVSAWIFFSALPLSSWAAGAGNACPGPVGQDHPLTPFHFYTNSIIEQNLDATTSGQYPFVKTACIVNTPPPPYPPTHVQWLVPGINGWLQADSPLPSHKLELGKAAQQKDGCLEYGNQSQFIEASFLADDEEAKGVEHEKNVGCRQAAAEIAHAVRETKGGEEKLINITQSVTNYFPSIAKYAEKTMLRLEGQAGVIVGDGSYTSYFRYTLSPLDNSSGDPSVVTVAPAFVGPAEVLAKDYSAQIRPR